MRFRCLFRGLTLSSVRNLNVILATAGLHNKCLEKNIPLPTGEIDDILPEDDNRNEGQMDSNEGRRLRDQLIQSEFGDEKTLMTSININLSLYLNIYDLVVFVQ